MPPRLLQRHAIPRNRARPVRDAPPARDTPELCGSHASGPLGTSPVLMRSPIVTIAGFLRSRAADLSAGLLVAAAMTAPAAAQDLRLTDAMATTIRGGAYASTNFASQQLLESRASDDATYMRRIVMKFDTQNTIPAGTAIASATLTLTVAGGNSEARTLTAYRIASSYDEPQATWNKRYSTTAWAKAGGDLAEKVGTATVTSAAGREVTFDVTAMVQGAVNGEFGSRYSRIALVDGGASSKESYKTYYSDEAADPGVRPVLTVTLGSAPVVPPSPSPAPSPTPSTSGTVQLRVLQWNLHHGVGTDGKYDINRIATWIAKMNPAVVTLNEVEKYTGWGNEDQPARYQALLEQKTGKKWYVLFTQEYGDWSSKGKGHVILSVYPLETTGHTTLTPSSGLNGAGAVGEASITVNGRHISLVVSHLDPSSQTMRLTQARETIAWALGFAENRIVTGDMNAWPDQSSIAEYNKTYADSWAVAESKGLAVQFAGLSPSGATKKGRIDYIFYSKNAANLVVRQSQVYDTRDSSGVMPSDHRPVVTTFDVR